jgi:hypothetical protein
MISFNSYDDVSRWTEIHGVAALRHLLASETMRSNSQSLADIWLRRHEHRLQVAGSIPRHATANRDTALG